MRRSPRWVSIRRPRPISSSNWRNGSATSSTRRSSSIIQRSPIWRITSQPGRASRMADRAALTSLADLLHHRAVAQPHDRAYLVLSDRGREGAAVTFVELERRATALARRLAARAAPGERALLLCPTGIEFITGLFG